MSSNFFVAAMPLQFQDQLKKPQVGMSPNFFVALMLLLVSGPGLSIVPLMLLDKVRKIILSKFVLMVMAVLFPKILVSAMLC